MVISKKNAVALNANIDKMLNAIVKHRIKKNSQVDNKVKVVAELIRLAYEDEVKNG